MPRFVVATVDRQVQNARTRHNPRQECREYPYRAPPGLVQGEKKRVGLFVLGQTRFFCERFHGSIRREYRVAAKYQPVRCCWVERRKRLVIFAALLRVRSFRPLLE